MADDGNSCKATNKRGMPCRAAATETGYCFFHSHPEKAAELGRSGGRNNRHVVLDDPRPLPPLKDAAAIKQAVAQIIEDVYAKRLSAKTAAGMAPLINTLLRTIQTQDLEDKVNALEQQLLKLSTDHSGKKGVERGRDAFAGTGEHAI
jgi:uncharacterized protein DUF5763